jgi:hypothetical protein
MEARETVKGIQMSIEDQWETKWIECSCHSHALSLSRYCYSEEMIEALEDDPDIYLSVWGFSEMNHDGWRWRITRAWHALRGNLHMDNVILNPSEAAKLLDALETMISQEEE